MRKIYIVSLIIFIVVFFAVMIASIEKKQSESFWRSFGKTFFSSKQKIKQQHIVVQRKKITSGVIASNHNENKKITKYKYIALILDDAGISKDFSILSYPKSLNISVLPGYHNTKLWVKKLKQKPIHETLLHIPMAPFSNKRIGLRPGMSKKRIKVYLKKWFKQVSIAKGANNHQGSYATSNSSFMRKFFQEYRKFNLYFVDSVTINKSKAYFYAKRYGVDALKRHYFIDNRSSLNYLTRQLRYSIRTAVKYGYCIAIGHVTTKNMYKALKSLENEMKKNKIKFVKISQLIKILQEKRQRISRRTVR